MRKPNMQRLFLTGLLTLLPIWLTWVVVKFVFVLLSDISRPLIGPALQRVAAQSPSYAWLSDSWVQNALALLATVGVIILSGVMARRVLGQRLLRWFEALVKRIPFANLIYGSARQLLDILQTQPDGTQRVVLVDFPHAGMKSIGFVTRVLKEQGSGRELAAVYVPTTPNPTSGFFLMMERSQVVELDMSVDAALKYIVSMGVVAPEYLPTKAPAPTMAPTESTNLDRK